MKKCSCCGRLLPEDKFGKDKRKKDGLTYKCKECKNFEQKVWQIKKELSEEKEKEYADATGGIKVYILNHPKRGEKRFNICSTDKWFFNTDDRDEFLHYLELQI